MLNDLGYSNYITVSQLNNYIHNSLAAESLLRGVVVYGEVSGCKISGPHAYFSLKDSSAVIACNCFNYANKYIVTDGESVLIKGDIDYYAKNGRLSLNVTKIEPVGKGLLHIQLEQLKEKLAREGLFDESIKKPLPPYMQKVCVLTAKTGAVIRDIIKTVRTKNEIIDIYLYDVRVQGEGAAESIIEALKTVDQMGFDCLIIARGGGSFEDLFCFNDEKLARTIAVCKTPIISAVGHQTDFTICDMVSDVRAATPTAAGELIAYDVKAIKQKLSTFVNGGLNVLNAIVTKESDRVKTLSDTLFDNYELYLERKQKELSAKLAVLDAHDPVAILKKGFFRVKHDDCPIWDISKLKKDTQFLLHGYNAETDGDGEVLCRVIDEGDKK